MSVKKSDEFGEKDNSARIVTYGIGLCQLQREREMSVKREVMLSVYR